MVKKRELDADDLEVWRTVAKHVTPLKIPFDFTSKSIQSGSKKPSKKNINLSFQLQPFKVGERATTSIPKQQPAISSDQKSVSPNMDRRNFQRLLKGQIEIDATLDLHGMTADQAKGQLQRTISQAHRNGLRMILVITGKGKKTNTDEFKRSRKGVIRNSLPDWLGGAGMAHLVLQVSQAQPKHGGQGAFYVYLRRKR